MSLEWTRCCKGRQSCPEIALEGDKVHIKDDYGNQVYVYRNNFPFFEELEDIDSQLLWIHGKESGKSPVRMTLRQFYELLETVDGLSESTTPP